MLSGVGVDVREIGIHAVFAGGGCIYRCIYGRSGLRQRRQGEDKQYSSASWLHWEMMEAR